MFEAGGSATAALAAPDYLLNNVNKNQVYATPRLSFHSLDCEVVKLILAFSENTFFYTLYIVVNKYHAGW